jgi:hypothetical protein
MKRLILYICMIALPLIAHTQKLSLDSASLRKLDTLRIERRLVVMGVTRMEYLQSDNHNLSLLNQSLVEKNTYNESYIGQIEDSLRHIEGLNKGLNEGLMREKSRKRGWRNLALFEGGILVIILAIIL